MEKGVQEGLVLPFRSKESIYAGPVLERGLALCFSGWISNDHGEKGNSGDVASQCLECPVCSPRF